MDRSKTANTMKIQGKIVDRTKTQSIKIVPASGLPGVFKMVDEEKSVSVDFAKKLNFSVNKPLALDPPPNQDLESGACCKASKKFQDETKRALTKLVHFAEMDHSYMKENCGFFPIASEARMLYVDELLVKDMKVRKSVENSIQNWFGQNFSESSMNIVFQKLLTDDYVNYMEGDIQKQLDLMKYVFIRDVLSDVWCKGAGSSLGNFQTTMRYVKLLSRNRFYKTLHPAIPVGTKRRICETGLAVPDYDNFGMN